jgi:holo-[acyl-carrier protein] synthase
VSVSVGIDLVAIAEVREAIARYGRRYLTRVYTEAELHDCDGRPERLAARYAAKEATTKALRATQALDWQSISIELDPHLRPAIVLTGDALSVAQRDGVIHCSLDLCVERNRALALVLAHVDSAAI